MKFYREKQFSLMVSHLRLPKNTLSRFIINTRYTFTKLKDYYPNSMEFALTIAKWTINNMQAKDGHFYYHNFDFISTKYHICVGQMHGCS